VLIRQAAGARVVSLALLRERQQLAGAREVQHQQMGQTERQILGEVAGVQELDFLATVDQVS